MKRDPELVRVQRYLEGLDPVEVAFRSCACLDQAQRGDLVARFNQVFGACTPPLTMAFIGEQS